MDKSKKAPTSPLKLSAGRESATHKSSISYFIKNVYSEDGISNLFLQGVYR